ncbi:MAG: glycoside hydrolase family 2 TIM barrel-domain containing protein [Chthoniobacterales bacterium]
MTRHLIPLAALFTSFFTTGLADPAKEELWDEAGVTFSMDEFAAKGGSSEFNKGATSLRLTPLPDSTADDPLVLDLTGTWKFVANPREGSLAVTDPSTFAEWEDIVVPADYEMEGKKAAVGGYARTIDIPADWSGKRVKLRFDEVGSAAKVWVNGEPVGEHIGHFIAFEFDVTDQIKFGESNVITVEASKESIARKLSGYSLHVAGGITRGVRIFAVPDLNVAQMHVATEFDDQYENATLQIELGLANEGSSPTSGSRVSVELRDAEDNVLPTKPASLEVPAIEAGKSLSRTLEVGVENPAHWTAETPNLYTLSLTLETDGRDTETVSRRIGFREIEIRGQELLVNGQPVKLRGTNRHIAHPLRARSSSPELARQDAEMFKAANCNFIRTAHYPASEEFIEACDELGLYVEEEAPFCFFNPKNDGSLNMKNVAAYIKYANLKMVQRDRSHPSILFWSIGNESRWGPYFDEAAKAVEKMDPTRGRTFMWFEGDPESLDIAAGHYPGPNGVQSGDPKRPKIFSEYCHVPAYAPFEMHADPVVDDQWGLVLEGVWNLLYPNKGGLGGAIWCGVDDQFHVPSDGEVKQVRGVSNWGIIDGWRRPKPEYWHTFKSYSPVLIDEKESLPVPSGGAPITLKVENRYDFTNLADLNATWTLGSESGTLDLDIAPRSSGEAVIPVTTAKSGDVLKIEFKKSDGALVNTFALPIGDELPTATSSASNEPWVTKESTDAYVLSRGNVVCRVDRSTGRLKIDVAGKTVMEDGPIMAYVPTYSQAGQKVQKRANKNGEPMPAPAVYGENWQLESLTDESSDELKIFRWTGSYDEGDLAGTFTFRPDGKLVVDYSLTLGTGVLREYDLVSSNRDGAPGQEAFLKMKDDATAILGNANSGTGDSAAPISNLSVLPRQLGLRFVLPLDQANLSWKRKGQWSVYPDDHIGRTEGTTTAFLAEDTEETLGVEPEWPWSAASSELGIRDFRATKNNVHHASLTDSSGQGLKLDSDTTQHSRAWVEGDRIQWLIASLDNGPSEGFINNFFAGRRTAVPLGGSFEDTIEFSFEGN